MCGVGRSLWTPLSRGGGGLDGHDDPWEEPAVVLCRWHNHPRSHDAPLAGQLLPAAAAAGHADQSVKGSFSSTTSLVCCKKKKDE